MAKRILGMTKFQDVLKRHAIEDIIDRGVEYTLKCPNIWGPNTGWKNFEWGFGNAWRDMYNNDHNSTQDIASRIMLRDILTESQLRDIARRVGIIEVLNEPVPPV